VDGTLTDSEAITITINGGSSVLFADDFEDGNMNGWSVVNSSGVASNWQVSNGELVQLNRVETRPGAFDESYHLGAYAYQNSLSGLTDYKFCVDVAFLSTKLGEADDIGIMFRRKDASNYYRFSMNSRYGFSRFEKVVNNVISTLAVNARGYDHIGNPVINLCAIAQGTSLQILVDDEPVFAADDASISSGSVALYTQDHVKFDNVVVEEIGSAKTIALATPIAYSVVTGSSFEAKAVALNVPANGKVEFLLDGNVSITDDTPPYEVTFTGVSQGDHKVEAILRDASNAEIARDTNEKVGVSGETILFIGDSLTNGEGDNFAFDNLFDDIRTKSFQGHVAAVIGLLNDSTATPNFGLNEGIGGDESADLLDSRIGSILERNSNTTQAVVLIGTNDSRGTLPVPSGAGCSGSACDGTFKGNVIGIRDNLIASGINKPTFVLIPPAWASSSTQTPYSDPLSASRNSTIQGYNSVIKNELGESSGLIGLGADLFDFYLSATHNRRELFYDYYLHFNALGYAVNASLIHNSLNPSNQVALPFILENISSQTTAHWVQQNYLEEGDTFYLDESYTLSSIPSVLEDGIWVMTNNADQTNSSNSFLSFDVDRPVTVYVGYDSGASSLPSWMSDFTSTGMTIGVSGNPGTSTFDLFSKTYPAGTINDIGGNSAAGASGASSNYLLIVVPN